MIEQVRLAQPRTEAEAQIAREEATKKISGQPLQPGNSPQAAVAGCRPNPPAPEGAVMTRPRRRRSSTSKSYDVGYRKPPITGRFQKGVSGHASGRRKGAKNATTVLNEALNEKVIVAENGTRRTLTKLEVGLQQLADRHANGDLRAIAMVLQKYNTEPKVVAGDGNVNVVLGPSDREVMDAAMERIRKALKETNND